MTSQPDELAPPSKPDRQRAAHHAEVALRSIGQSNSVTTEFDFWNDRYEGRRLFSELLGTFFLVLVAVGGGMVSARFGGNAVPYGAKVVAPALMVMAIILFMGTVSGAHLNPTVSIAFAARGDFPWKRVPAYIVALFLGAILANLLLWAFAGKQGSAGLTLPGSGISTTSAMLWELILTAGLVSVILGIASGAPQIGPLAAPRCGRLYRAGRAVGLAAQRGVDEPGPLSRRGPGEGRLDLVVGLPARPGGRRPHRGGHRLRAVCPRRRPQRDSGRPGHPQGRLAPRFSAILSPASRFVIEQRKWVAMTVTSEGAARTCGRGPGGEGGAWSR
jgi:hypothetical protein